MWKEIFGDPEEFINIYFDNKFSPSVTSYATEGGALVSAMQSLPYRMTFCGKYIKVGYASGIATFPAARHKGYAAQIMAQSHRMLYRRGAVMSLLIPASPALFDFYAMRQYATCFYRETQVIQPIDPKKRKTIYTSSNFFNKMPAYKLSPFIRNWLRKNRSCCVLHDTKDLEVIESVAKLSGGGFYALMKNDKIAAAVLLEYTNSYMQVTDAFGDMKLVQEALDNVSLSMPIHWQHHPADTDAEPYGMARIVNVFSFLQLYAGMFPDKEFSFSIRDDGEVLENNATYFVHDGRCEKMQPDPSVPAIPLQEITQSLLTPLHPVMSMMLN